MNTVEVKNLVKTFPIKGGKLTAVDNVSFEIKKGEIFGLLGVNGAGKSTMISILSDLMSADSGKIEMFGKDFSKNKEECKSKFNIATAYYSLHHRLSVKKNLEVFANLYNVKKPKKKIEALCKQFMITHLLDTKLMSLSSGEKTRVVLVKALLNDPELLFLDECTVGLDPEMAEVTRDLLEKYNKETGCSILFTSHYMQEVERLCDRIAFMNDGRIVKVGTAKELLKELQMQKVTLHFTKNKEQAIKILKNNNIDYEEVSKGKIAFRIKNKNKIIYPLLEKFVKANLPFADIHLEKPTLEEYFIQQSRKSEMNQRVYKK